MATKMESADSDSVTDRNLFSRLVEYVIVFAISAFLLNLGVQYILAVRVPLIVISVIVIVVIVLIRISIWKGRHDDY